jgi:hypothetical protein
LLNTINSGFCISYLTSVSYNNFNRTRQCNPVNNIFFSFLVDLYPFLVVQGIMKSSSASFPPSLRQSPIIFLFPFVSSLCSLEDLLHWCAVLSYMYYRRDVISTNPPDYI